ncbi:MAG TPA: hydrogenase maturation nickel metallochaperone HypA [candidate division Zixibacteria bacterium]|nr:hydrogenase maturation nickel metallochaperone HypA [candidate division Zixibacteria bacterium]
MLTGGKMEPVMHELRVATEIMEIVRQEMIRRKLTGIKEVGVRLGALSGFDAEALAFSFEAAVVDTALDGARLKIEQVPVKGKCRSCGRDFEVNEFVFICPHCGSGEMDMTQGEELDITYLVEDKP